MPSISSLYNRIFSIIGQLTAIIGFILAIITLWNAVIKSPSVLATVSYSSWDWPKTFTVDMNEAGLTEPNINGQYTIKITNYSNEKAENIALYIPHAVFAEVNYPNFAEMKLETDQYSVPIEIGELQPDQSLEIFVWSSMRPVWDNTTSNIKLTYDKGIGKIIFDTNSSIEAPPSPIARWFQFNIITLLLLFNITTFSALVGLFVWTKKQRKPTKQDCAADTGTDAE